MNWPPLRDSEADVSSISPSSERIRRDSSEIPSSEGFAPAKG